MTLRLADPFQLLMFTGPSAAGLHTTCHIRLKCSALGDGDRTIISSVVKQRRLTTLIHTGLPAEAKAHGKKGGVQKYQRKTSTAHAVILTVNISDIKKMSLQLNINDVNVQQAGWHSGAGLNQITVMMAG